MAPSKELLSAVLGDEYKDRLVNIITIEGNTLSTYYDCDSGKPNCLGLEYNIYEFIHLCKEWLTKTSEGRIETYTYEDCVSVKLEEHKYPFSAKTEPDAVISTCKWMLQQIKSKEIKL